MTADTDPAGSAPGTVVYLGLGSNLGDRAAHLAFGLRELRAHGRLTGVSAVYESEPVGYTDQPRFLNMVVGLETTRRPRALLDAILAIERERGRTRAFQNAPRTLDIDILAVGPAGAPSPPPAEPEATPTGAQGASGTDSAAAARPGTPAFGRDGVVRQEGLRVPHPRMVERPFVLVPLLELAPDLPDPETGRPYAGHLADLFARQGVEPDDTMTVAGPTGPGEAGPTLSGAALDALGLRRVMDGRELLEDVDGESGEPDGPDA